MLLQRTLFKKIVATPSDAWIIKAFHNLVTLDPGLVLNNGKGEKSTPVPQARHLQVIIGNTCYLKNKQKEIILRRINQFLL